MLYGKANIKIMSCEICGRGNCVASFHSIEEQQSFDEIADNVKDRSKSRIYDAVNRLTDGEWITDEDGNEKYVVVLDDVLKVIDNVSF